MSAVVWCGSPLIAHARARLVPSDSPNARVSLIDTASFGCEICPGEPGLGRARC